jgi:molybdate ABC transporter, periplasmic molybdate-binding protein
MFASLRKVASAVLAATAAVALAACSGGAAPSSSSTGASAASERTITVFAAASLKGTYTEIGKKVEAANPGLKVKFSFLGSQDLVSQLSNGADAQVLATANKSTMNDAVKAGVVGTPTEFATNVLTLIVPKGNPAKVTGLDASLDNAKLVICAPAVPCGAATVKLTKAAGITLKPVSEEQKVTDVRTKVETGEADAGLVYTTDAKASGDKVETIKIDSHGVVNHYLIAPTKSAANNKDAKIFIDYVNSKEGQAILAKAGFGAPATK